MIGPPLSVIGTIRCGEGKVHPVYRDGPRAWEATVDIAYLEEFEVLARELNFGRAADKSYVSRTTFRAMSVSLKTSLGSSSSRAHDQHA